MNMKRTFGAILSILGIIGLIYTGVMIINRSNGITTMIVVGVISVIFFTYGMGLVRNTTDETK
ncbi:MAG: hypothetical protein ACTHNW_01750 [Mucilaginibacter sp.]